MLYEQAFEKAQRLSQKMQSSHINVEAWAAPTVPQTYFVYKRLLYSAGWWSLAPRNGFSSILCSSFLKIETTASSRVSPK